MAVTTEQVWHRLGHSLRSYLRRRVTDEARADDLLQDVFLRIHRGLPSLRDETRLAPWVYQIARNTLLNERRGPSPASLVEQPVNVSDEASESITQGLEGCIETFVRSLPEIYRDAMILAEIEDFSYREIAEQLNLSISGVKSRVQRGRELIKEMLLDCCRFEFDCRGTVIGWERRRACHCQ